MMTTDSGVEAREAIPRAPEASPSRLISLDAFRGLTILGMLLVNNVAVGVHTPSQLTHAPWNAGVHAADLVFPWFLFIVGAALPFSFHSNRSKGGTAGGFYARALKRAVLLVAIGCLLDSSLAHRPTVGLGVLQLIGLAYLVGAVVYPLRTWKRLSVAALFLLAHWAAIRFVDIPGIGAGAFTESSNLIVWLNERYLQGMGLKGVVSAVPTSAMVMIGSAAGDLLRNSGTTAHRKPAILLISGFALMLAGWLWNLDLPFNKPVWTASYIIFSAGLGSAVLALFYLIIDLAGVRLWAFPLVVFGSNAIAAYAIPILVKVYVLRGWTLAPGGPSLQDSALAALRTRLGEVPGGWAYTGLYILAWWLVLLYLYRRKFFLRV